MLQAFRDNLKGTMAIIIVGLMIVPFALFGVDSLFLQDNSAGKAADVNGVAIAETDLTRAIRVQKQQLLERLGDQAPADLLSDEQLRGPVLTRLLQRELLRQAAENGSMAVSDASLDQLIKNTPQFQQDGRFNADLYLQLLRNMGYSPVTYKKLLTQDLLVNQHATGLSNSAFATAGDIDSLSALTQQTRSFYYLTLPYGSAANNVAVSEDEITAYYSDNSDSFRTTEQVSLDYIELSLDGIAETTDVDPEAVRAQYQQEVANFESAIQRQAAHILIEYGDGAEDKLAQAQQRLAEGEVFEAVAAELSDDLGSSELGGDLGMTDGNTFPEAFETALAQLEVDQVSAPVETDAGTHIIKLLAKEEAQPPSFESAQSRIQESLAQAAAESVFIELLEELPEAAYNAENLMDVADSLGLEAITSQPFSRIGGAGILSNNQVIAAAFSGEVLEEGLASEVIELSDNHVVVVKLNKHMPSALMPLEDVRDEVVLDLTKIKVTEQLTLRAQEIVKKLESGQSLQATAEAEGLEWQVSADTPRGQGQVNRELMTRIFELPKPVGASAVNTVLPVANGDVLVAQLTVVKAGTLPPMDDAQKRAISQRLAQELANSELAIYQSMLNDKASVEIY
ncbi:MAG: peptidylprolyl isomerase [Cellvibrionaceae bacterium]|nr:peptidylprolyl isomerase [Cellvibrionaceae bacterium]|tara:strand:- start:428 stop:2302 length:1875 start_codon:yes stop_codon:yes gene_type:complete